MRFQHQKVAIRVNPRRDFTIISFEIFVLWWSDPVLGNYRQSPYLDYSRSRALMFPVKEKNDKFRNKALVLGVRLGTTTRAYPFNELRKHGADTFEDVIGAHRVTIEWSETDDFARVLDDGGEELPSIIAYWFAWYAFHPDTEIFHVDVAE